ncbi:MAG: tRNA preQ1(34) S-adenosylmethionine ribosyltransferase-isomerase QueA [Planctomycetota bacterium]
MRTSDFDFELPPELVASHPAERRDEARLLVVDRTSGELGDSVVRDLPRWLARGDLLVLNDTKVLFGRLFARRTTGGKVEILLLRREPGGTCRALVKAHRHLRPGEVVELEEDIRAELIERDASDGIWRVRFHGDLDAALPRIGHVPLPPYLKRDDTPGDRERYQTVFARDEGSAAAPTAGLHFTKELFASLAEAGIANTKVTLHVGYGTFKPIKVDHIADHRVDGEQYEVTAAAAASIQENRGRLVTVGTTSTRVLETLARTGGIRAEAGSTDLFLYPGEPFLAVDALMTNFHLPMSSLFLLVCAFAGREAMLAAYEHAIANRYRFYSYGDAMLIL